MNIKAYFRMTDGVFHMKRKNDLSGLIRSLKDGLYLITIEKVYDARTNPQNRYYWGVVVKAYVQGVLEEWGEVVGIQEAHESLKAMFCFTEREVGGEVFKVISSTRKFSTVQFNEYIENCRRFIAEYFNLETPDPE